MLGLDDMARLCVGGSRAVYIDRRERSDPLKAGWMERKIDEHGR